MTVSVCGILDLLTALENTFVYLRDVIPLDELRINVLDSHNHAIRVLAVVGSGESKIMLENPKILPVKREVENELGAAINEPRQKHEETVFSTADTPAFCQFFRRAVKIVPAESVASLKKYY